MRIYHYRVAEMSSTLPGDAQQYVIYGYNLYTNGTFSRESNTSDPRPDSYRSPGFPLLVAAGMKLFGPQYSFHFILILQIVMGSILVLLTYQLSRMVLGTFLALLSAFLVAISPHLIAAGDCFLTGTTFAFTHLIGILTFLAALQNKNRALFIISGAIFGYSYLVNPVILFLPFVLSAAVFFGQKIRFKEWKKHETVKGLIGFLLVFSLFIGGWGLRNMISVAEGSLKSKNRIIVNFVIGSHYDFFADFKATPRGPDYIAAQEEIKRAEGTYLGFLKGFLPRLAKEPVKFLSWYSIEKPLLLYGWDIRYGTGDIYIYDVANSPYAVSGMFSFSRFIMKQVHKPMVIFFFGGILVSLFLTITGRLSPDRPEALLTYTILYITLIYVILQSEPRFSIPFRSEFYILSLYAIRSFSGTVKERFLSH